MGLQQITNNFVINSIYGTTEPINFPSLVLDLEPFKIYRRNYNTND